MPISPESSEPLPPESTQPALYGVMTVILIDVIGIHHIVANATPDEFFARFTPLNDLIRHDLMSSNVWIQDIELGTYLCKFGVPGGIPESNAKRAIQLAHQLLRHNYPPLWLRISISTGQCGFPSNGYSFLIGQPILRVRQISASRTHAPILVDPETLAAASLTPTSPGVTPFTLTDTDKGPELQVFGLSLPPHSVT